MKKRTLNPFLFLLFLGVFATIYVGCKKEDSSEKFPPNTVPTCNDGILNQGEYKIDCGGPCNDCNLIPTMSAVIDSFWVDTSMRGPGLWAADTMYAEESELGDELFIIGNDTGSSKAIAFVHNQAFQRGVYIYEDIEGTTFGCELSDGIVEFTAFDPVKKTISGTFSFNCIGHSSGKKERIINGKFEDITYR